MTWSRQDIKTGVRSLHGINRLTEMLNPLLIVSLVSFVGIGLVWSAPQSVRPTQGKCWTNGTHWGDEGPYVTELPSCWVAICREESSTVIVATLCTAGPDIDYSSDEMKDLMERHCYPSRRGELTGDQCCGGYLICAHDGDNRGNFNIGNYLKIMFEWLERGKSSWPFLDQN